MKWLLHRQFTLGLLAAILASSPATATTVRIAADTLTIHANRAPLSDILAQLQDAGIRVAMDERINPLITADFDNQDIINGIKQILTDCDYALVWDTIDGPVGKIKRLSEVLVYKTGDRRTLKPLPLPPANVAQTQTATNTITCLKNEVLLRLRPGVTQDQFRALLLRTGAMVLDGIPTLGIYRLRLPPGSNLAEILNTLANDPLVANAEPNQIYRSITPVKTGDNGNALTPRTASATTGPAVAILDSGFTSSTALEKAVVATLDATSPGQDITDPLGHGTQMAFLASGAVNPDGTDASASVSIIPIRTLDNNGITSSFSLMQGMVFAMENGAKVISMSWGSPNNSPLFTDALAYAKQRGAILVAAAGNEPTGQPLYPAALPGVIAVAAMTADGNVWDQSNYGSFVAFAAPGFADLPVGYKAPPGHYGGTSISAAYTANLIARYLTAHPKADAAEAVAALTKALSTAPSGAGTLHPEIPRLNNAAIAAFLK
jgi:hypothetical protein